MMKTNIYITNIKVHFSRWCRKGYALFFAIGKEVRISSLSIRMCKTALLKSVNNGVILDVTTTVDDIPELLQKRRWHNVYNKTVMLMGEVCGDEIEDREPLLVYRRGTSDFIGCVPFSLSLKKGYDC